MKCNIVDIDSLNKLSRNHEVLSISTEEFFVKLVVIYCEDKSPICVNCIKEKNRFIVVLSSIIYLCITSMIITKLNHPIKSITDIY